MRIKLTNNAILILIILVAGILRLYHLFEIPYTYDEFSALFRTHFNSFSELIEKGVKIDGHPAGIQVLLYYWTKLWGYSEWIVKLPFIISGILSVFIVYLIARKWYNETVALISASFLASIQYTIIYSQIARPYISGLFFSLLMVYFWTNIMLTTHKRFYINSLFFIISSSLCTYNHHFSLLFAVIVSLSGLFYINRQYLTKYIISCVFIIILYIPHIRIFLYQLHVGGVEGWLGKPHNDFLINYISYLFNFTAISCGLSVSLILFGIFNITKKDLKAGQFIMFASWFFLPFLIGFFYSIYVNSILQYSVLMFSFPFLYFILFGHIKPQNVKINLIIVLAVLSINIFSVIKERKHYILFYNSPFTQILADHQKAESLHDDIASVIDSNKKISDYYIRKYHFDTNFTWFDSFLNEKEFISYLEKQSKLCNYLYLGCLSSNNPLTVPIIRDYYPTIELQNDYAGGTTYIFSKSNKKDNNIIEYQDFELKDKKYWSSLDNNKLIDTIYFSGKTSYLIDDNTEFSPIYSRSFDEIIKNKNNFIDISVRAYLPDNYDEIILVASLDSKDKNVFWGGVPFDKFIDSTTTKNNKWISVHHSMKLSDIYLNYHDIQLKVYIWNKGKNHFFIDDFTIELRNGNPVIYGLNEKIMNMRTPPPADEHSNI